MNTRGTDIIDAIRGNALQQFDKGAIESPRSSITYGEYYGRACTLAEQLKAQTQPLEVPAQQPNHRVLVLLKHHEQIPIALLGILLAGATYVPMDIRWPDNKIIGIIEDLAPCAIITDLSDLDLNLRPALHKQLANHFLIALPETSQQNIQHFTPSVVSKDSTACIIFTSGTTGKPKGVALSYDNLQFFMASAASQYHFATSDRHLAIAKATFSISLFDLLLPFYCGGTLVVKPREALTHAPSLAAWLTEVSCVHMGPALLGALIDFALREQIQFPTLRHVSSGGDSVPAELLESCKAVFPNAELWVIYGCTEIACMGMTWLVPRDVTTRNSYVGKPFRHTQVKLLDEKNSVFNKQITEGEVCFSSPGVANGYVDLPDATQKNFITIDGERFYRTGDIALLTSNGLYRLLGRKDFQIKLNGVRVEPTGIEHCLKHLPGINAAAVVGAKNQNNETKLIAFVTQIDNALDAPTIKQHLQANFPAHLIPASIISLDALPLNRNLKLDRRALITLAENHLRTPTQTQDFTDPMTAQLANLWVQSGVTERLHPHSNYFESGGDSFGAAALIELIQQHLSASLPIQDIYDYPTLAEQRQLLAQLEEQQVLTPEHFYTGNLTSQVNSETASHALSMPLNKPRSAAQQRIFFVPGVGGHPITFRDFGNYFSSSWEVFGLIYPGFNGVHHTSIVDIAKFLLAEVRRIQPRGPYYLCGYSMGGLVCAEMARILLNETNDNGAKPDVFLVLLEARLYEHAPKKSLLRRLPIFVWGKLARSIQQRRGKKLALINSLADPDSDADYTLLPQRVRDVFTAGVQQSEAYRASYCEANAVLIKCTKTIWWDKLRHWLDDYGWSKHLHVITSMSFEGDHLAVRNNTLHPPLAQLTETAFDHLIQYQMQQKPR